MENKKEVVKTDVRKLQKSPSGFYINLPKRVASTYNLSGNELIKFIPGEDDKLVLEIIRL